MVDRKGQKTDNTFLTTDGQAGRGWDQDLTFTTETDIFHYFILKRGLQVDPSFGYILR